jgi:hypothetical protein
MSSADQDSADLQHHRLRARRKATRANLHPNRSPHKTACQHHYLPLPRDFASSPTRRRWSKSSLAALPVLRSDLRPTNPRIRNIASAQNAGRDPLCRQTTDSIDPVERVAHMLIRVNDESHGNSREYSSSAEQRYLLQVYCRSIMMPTLLRGTTLC